MSKPIMLRDQTASCKMKIITKYMAFNHSWLIVPRQFKVLDIYNQPYYIYLYIYVCVYVCVISASDTANKV